MRLFYLVFLFVFFCFASCHKNHLYVQMENVGADDLASTHVQTPDFRQENPPKGQRIIVSWNFPYALFSRQLSMFVTVRFWNNTQETKIVPLPSSWGTKTFFFSNPEMHKDLKVLTYRIQIVSKTGEIIEEWKQHLWTKLINIDQ